MANPSQDRRYGWRPDRPDMRDFYFTAIRAADNVPSVDLRPKMPPIYDQGSLGSCTANAIAAAIEFERGVQNLPDFVPSRIFIYYNEREIENDVAADNGAEIRDGIKSVASQGVCPETEWPYDPTQFSIKPPQSCYTDALQNLVTSYARVSQTLNGIRSVLATGHPVIFGFSVYESFESEAVAENGIVPMPQPSETMVGGHAVLIAGYDDAKQMFLVRNSWGSGWGQGGYCWMPYPYLTNSDLASDFWTITTVSQPKLVGVEGILQSLKKTVPAFAAVPEPVGKFAASSASDDASANASSLSAV